MSRAGIGCSLEVVLFLRPETELERQVWVEARGVETRKRASGRRPAGPYAGTGLPKGAPWKGSLMTEGPCARAGPGHAGHRSGVSAVCAGSQPQGSVWLSGRRNGGLLSKRSRRFLNAVRNRTTGAPRALLPQHPARVVDHPHVGDTCTTGPSCAYVPRTPQETLLYEVLQNHLESFLTQASADGRTLPAFVIAELRSFLRCGVHAYGFNRLRCSTCRHEFAVPFSCKGRGFCPSCSGRHRRWCTNRFPPSPRRAIREGSPTGPSHA